MRVGKYLPDNIKFLMRKYFFKIKFYRSRESYRKLKNNNSATRLILLGTPEYGNLGDHAIALAEMNFLKLFFSNYECIEITQENLKWDEHGVFKHIKSNDVLLYTGGGFIGSMYMHTGGGILRKVINYFPENKIIIFPSTIYYENSVFGRKIKQEDFSSWNACKNFHIFLRDINSYTLCKTELAFGIEKSLTLDMVFSLKWDMNLKRSGVKLVLRKDKESIQNIDIKKLEDTILELGFKYTYSSTRVDYDILPENRKSEVYKKLEEFASAELIITDRLHGMIFSIITGTPCLVLDNRSYKLSGVLSVIGNPDYVVMSSDKNIIKDLRMIVPFLTQKYKYTSKMLKCNYDKLKKCIEDNIET